MFVVVSVVVDVASGVVVGGGFYIVDVDGVFYDDFGIGVVVARVVGVVVDVHVASGVVANVVNVVVAFDSVVGVDAVVVVGVIADVCGSCCWSCAIWC